MDCLGAYNEQAAANYTAGDMLCAVERHRAQCRRLLAADPRIFEEEPELLEWFLRLDLDLFHLYRARLGDAEPATPATLAVGLYSVRPQSLAGPSQLIQMPGQMALRPHPQ